LIRSDDHKGEAPVVGALLEKTVLVILILLAATVFHMAGDFSDGTPSGGHVFPRLASGTVFAMATIALFQPQTGGYEVEMTLKPFVVVGLTLAFLLLMPSVGYPLVAPLWIGATMWIFGLRNFAAIVLIACGLSAIAWILLSRLAFAPPPAGVFDVFL